MVFGAADLEHLLAELGESVALGSTTVKGLVDRPGDSVLEGGGVGGIQSTDVIVSIKAGSLPELAIGADITIDGAPYKVRRFLSIHDGAFTQIYCAVSL